VADTNKPEHIKRVYRAKNVMTSQTSWPAFQGTTGACLREIERTPKFDGLGEARRYAPGQAVDNAARCPPSTPLVRLSTAFYYLKEKETGPIHWWPLQRIDSLGTADLRALQAHT